MIVGLITIYQVPNYGSVLQAYATQFLFEGLGTECRIINYKYPNEWHWNQGGGRPHNWRNLIRRYIPSKRTRIFNQFRKNYFNFTELYCDLDELKASDWSGYDRFVVGSDQVWNSRFVLGDSAFMLSFIPDDKPRFSLASSFAMDTLPERYRKKYYAELSKFTALSVRESSGVNIIKNELGINKAVETILDPTLLLSKDVWFKAVRRSSFKKKRPYIVLYMLTYAFEPRPYIYNVIRHFQKKMDCDILALEGYTNLQNSNLRMIDVSKSTIEEFIDIFANADLVITSSFHGTAFALNFGIPLVSIIPNDFADNRQKSLLSKMGCEQCAVVIGTALDQINPQYDIKEEQHRLDQLRENCILWINNNIIKQTKN